MPPETPPADPPEPTTPPAPEPTPPTDEPESNPMADAVADIASLLAWAKSAPPTVARVIERVTKRLRAGEEEPEPLAAVHIHSGDTSVTVSLRGKPTKAAALAAYVARAVETGVVESATLLNVIGMGALGPWLAGIGKNAAPAPSEG